MHVEIYQYLWVLHEHALTPRSAFLIFIIDTTPTTMAAAAAAAARAETKCLLVWRWTDKKYTTYYYTPKLVLPPFIFVTTNHERLFKFAYTPLFYAWHYFVLFMTFLLKTSKQYWLWLLNFFPGEMVELPNSY